MEDTGQISASEKAKPGSKKEKKKLLHCYGSAYLQFLTIIISLLSQNNDLCMLFFFLNLCMFYILVPHSYSFYIEYRK